MPIQTGRSMPEHGNTCQDTPFLVPPGTTATQACVRWPKCTVLNTKLWLLIRKTAQILNAKFYKWSRFQLEILYQQFSRLSTCILAGYVQRYVHSLEMQTGADSLTINPNPNPNPALLNPKSGGYNSVKDYYCAKLQVFPIRDTHTHTSRHPCTYPPTH